MGRQVSRAVIQGASTPALLPFVERNWRPSSIISLQDWSTTKHCGWWLHTSPFLGSISFCPLHHSFLGVLGVLQKITVHIAVCTAAQYQCAAECLFWLYCSHMLAENCAQYHLDHTKFPITGKDTLQLSLIHGCSLSISLPQQVNGWNPTRIIRRQLK